MTKRTPVALTTVLVSMFLTFPALDQPAKDAVPASADLGARVKAVQANPAQFEASYKLGSKAAAVCALCHGDNGNSLKPDIPNLAGLTLKRYRDGSSLRKVSMMASSTNAMTDEDISSVATYVSSLK